MITIQLNPDEAAILHQILDQVNVKGVPAKLALAQIMAKIEEASKPKPEETENDKGR